MSGRPAQHRSTPLASLLKLPPSLNHKQTQGKLSVCRRNYAASKMPPQTACCSDYCNCSGSASALPPSISLHTHSTLFPRVPSAATAAAPFWAACVLIILCVLRQNKAKLARFNIFNCLEIYSYQAGCSACLSSHFSPSPSLFIFVCLGVCLTFVFSSI